MKRLTAEIKEFILTAHRSYSAIIEDIQERFNRKIAKSTVSYYRGKREGRVKRLDLQELERFELAYLAGLLLADGCAYSRAGNYEVIFSLSAKKDKNIISYVTQLLELIKAGPRIKVVHGEARVRVCSKELYNLLSKFLKREYTHSFLNSSDVMEKLAFVGGLIDGDGFIRKRRKSSYSIEFFQSKRRWLIPLLHDFFKEMLGPSLVSVKKDGTFVYVKTNGVRSFLRQNLIFCWRLSKFTNADFLFVRSSRVLGAGEGI